MGWKSYCSCFWKFLDCGGEGIRTEEKTHEE